MGRSTPDGLQTGFLLFKNPRKESIQDIEHPRPRKPTVNVLRWFYPHLLPRKNFQFLSEGVAPREVRGDIRVVFAIGIGHLGQNPGHLKCVRQLGIDVASKTHTMPTSGTLNRIRGTSRSLEFLGSTSAEAVG